MRTVTAFILTILCGAASAYSSSSGLVKLNSIKDQFVENSLSMEKYFKNDISFKSRDSDEQLGSIYEYNTKSPTKAFLFSLAVPGAGEFYLGQKIKAGSFLVADIALWAGYFIFKGKGRDKEDEYQSFANQWYSPADYLFWWDMQDSITQQAYSHRLPVDNSGSPIYNHEYYENIGKYHQFQVGWYDIGLNNPPSSEGGFVSPLRAQYLTMRAKSNDYFATATTIAMVSIANHIVSAFDAAIGAKKFNRGAKEYSLRLKTKKYDGKTTPFLVLSAKF